MNLDISSYRTDNIKKFMIGSYAFLLPFSDWLPVKLNNLLIILLTALSLYGMFARKPYKLRILGHHYIILSSIFLIQIISFFQGGSFADIQSGVLVKLPFLFFPMI